MLTLGYLVSIMSYTCMISLANKVGCPAKVVWPIAFFLNSKHFFVGHWPADLMGWQAKAIIFIYISHMVMDLK